MERLLILNLLPKEESYASLKVIRDLQNTIGLADEEWQEFEIKQESDGKITWNEKGKMPKDFEIGFKARQIVNNALTKLDEQGKLNMQLMEVYEKFMEER